MGTFQKTETVDARQFLGGKENGANLALWVNSNGQSTDARAEWLEGIKNTHLPIPERVRLRTCNFRTYAYVDDWIIRKQDGTFDCLRPQEFASEGYIQV